MTRTLRFLTVLFWMVLAVCSAGCGAAESLDSPRVGLIEDCSTSSGWYELGRDGARLAPRVKMTSKDGLLHIKTNRARLRVARRYKWVAPGADWLTRLYKDYGQVDLDRYRYLVVKIKAKGSAVFFGVNNFNSKAGYTTGVTCIDLADYDDPTISGTRPVRLELDLHDNTTTLVLDEIKLVSELTPEEKKGFVGRGLTIRKEGLTYKDYHGLEELRRRGRTAPPKLDREEMVVFRDTATGAVSTRLTAGGGNDFFGEGGIWSPDGAAIRFSSKGRDLQGVPVYYLADGSVTSTGKGYWAQWSRSDPTKLLLVSRKGLRFTVHSWDRSTGQSEEIISFDVPGVGGYTEVKRFTRSGKLVIAFRETPNMFVVDTVNKKVKYIKLSTRLKDAGLSEDEKFVSWYNCYTYEGRWRNLETGEEGISGSYSAGHGCGAVRSFGPYLKLITKGSISRDRTPGDKIQIWANWQNRILTDYGSFTSDRKWIFTNGTRGDVERQHVMAPSADPGAVLRVARYFTKFSWESTTYSRPSPDYTKVVYNENVFGPTQLVMAYTRRTDPPRNVVLDRHRITWDAPQRAKEIKGYNIYASRQSGRDYVKINDELVTGMSYQLPDTSLHYAVTSVEHSRLESMFSTEVTGLGSHTYYFEAERQKLTPPARRFYDGYCNDFQCVRINAESPQEQARAGVVAIDISGIQRGRYAIWGLVKGKGRWNVLGRDVQVNTDHFQWMRLAEAEFGETDKPLQLSASADSLKLDTVMLTTERFTPSGKDPRDTTAPSAVSGLSARVDRGSKQVELSWQASQAPDLHHYSVYVGQSEDFPCDNSTVIRSVYKNSVTDAGMATGKPLHYKVVAYDSRDNASAQAVVRVDLTQ